MNYKKRRIIRIMAAFLVAAGASAPAVAGAAEQPERHHGPTRTAPCSNAGMQRMHELMIDGNPGMMQMHSRMMQSSRHECMMKPCS